MLYKPVQYIDKVVYESKFGCCTGNKCKIIIYDILYPVIYLRDEIYCFTNKIKLLYYWLPVIWKTEWWDYSFFLRIMSHHLKYMKKNWDKSYSEDYKETENILEILTKTLDRIVKDDYDSVFNYEQFGDGILDYDTTYYGKKVEGDMFLIPDVIKQRDLETFCRCLQESCFRLWD